VLCRTLCLAATEVGKSPFSHGKMRQMTDVGRVGNSVASLQKSARAQAWGAAGRALIAGYVDSYTLLNFGVYASFMSGNTTSGGLHVGQANVAAAAHSLLPIPFFLLCIFVGTLLMYSDRRPGAARSSALVAAMLSIEIVAAYFAWPGWFSILALSTAMGVMNTSITYVGGQSVSLGFVTGDLNNLGQCLALGIKRAPVQYAQGPWDTHWMRAALLAGIWTAFFIGAVLGAALAAQFAIWTLLPAIFLLMVFALMDRASI
jgi:uncharacterized membrane protein YoaK (UPF0700 family)